MLKPILFTLGFMFASQGFYGQQITGSELLKKMIHYHDPVNNRETYNDQLTILLESPNRKTRTTHIEINIPNEYFYSKVVRENNKTEYSIT